MGIPTKPTDFFSLWQGTRVCKKKATLCICINKVDLQAQKVHKVLFFNQDFEAFGVVPVVSRFGLIKTNDIGKAGAPCTLYTYAQAIAFRNIFTGENFYNFLPGSIGNQYGNFANRHGLVKTGRILPLDSKTKATFAHLNTEIHAGSY